jgi:acyl-CoA hydrolase
MKQVKYVSAQEAVSIVKSGDRVHLSSVAVTPLKLVHALTERGRAGEIRNVSIQHIHIEGAVEFANPEFEGIFNSTQFFVGSNLRKQTQAGYADYIPVFLSETQKLIRDGYLKVNVAMIMVSPPDKHGYVSLGTSVDATLAAVECADTVIALVNPNVPRAWGDAQIPLDMIDIFVEDNSPLYAVQQAPLSDVEKQIGINVAALVEDGACLQLGIGGIPNAVLAQLGITRIWVFTLKCSPTAFYHWLKKESLTEAERKLTREKWSPLSFWDQELCTTLSMTIQWLQ